MTTPPIFSICYASKRPDVIKRKVNEWLTRASYPDAVEVIVCVDEDDGASFKVASAIKGVAVVKQTDKPYDCVKAFNLAAAHSTGDIIMGLDDDQEPCPAWDHLIQFSHPGDWWLNPHVIAPRDGVVSERCGMPIVTRAWYNMVGGHLFYPEYRSMYADSDLTEQGKVLGMWLPVDNTTIKHQHHTQGKRTKDAVDELHCGAERCEHGRLIFERRRAEGFPLVTR